MYTDIHIYTNTYTHTLGRAASRLADPNNVKIPWKQLSRFNLGPEKYEILHISAELMTSSNFPHIMWPSYRVSLNRTKPKLVSLCLFTKAHACDHRGSLDMATRLLLQCGSAFVDESIEPSHQRTSRPSIIGALDLPWHQRLLWGNRSWFWIQCGWGGLLTQGAWGNCGLLLNNSPSPAGPTHRRQNEWPHLHASYLICRSGCRPLQQQSTMQAAGAAQESGLPSLKELGCLAPLSPFSP